MTRSTSTNASQKKTRIMLMNFSTPMIVTKFDSYIHTQVLVHKFQELRYRASARSQKIVHTATTTTKNKLERATHVHKMASGYTAQGRRRKLQAGKTGVMSRRHCCRRLCVVSSNLGKTKVLLILPTTEPLQYCSNNAVAARHPRKTRLVQR